MKLVKTYKLEVEVFSMTNKKQQNKNPRQSETEKRAGYGDKKLEGPNRPAE